MTSMYEHHKLNHQFYINDNNDRYNRIKYILNKAIKSKYRHVTNMWTGGNRELDECVHLLSTLQNLYKYDDLPFGKKEIDFLKSVLVRVRACYIIESVYRCINYDRLDVRKVRKAIASKEDYKRAKRQYYWNFPWHMTHGGGYNIEIVDRIFDKTIGKNMPEYHSNT